MKSKLANIYHAYNHVHDSGNIQLKYVILLIEGYESVEI